MTAQQLKPYITNEEKYATQRMKLQEQQQRGYNSTGMKQFDRSFTDGEEVMMRKTPDSLWEPAIITQKANTPRSYTVDTGESQLRRNTRDIITSTPADPMPETSSQNTPVSMESNNDAQSNVNREPVPETHLPVSPRVKRASKPPKYLNDYVW